MKDGQLFVMKKFFFIHEEPNTNILNVESHILAFLSNELKELTGGNLTEIWFKTKDTWFQWGPREDEWRGLGEMYIETLRRDPLFARVVEDKVREVGEAIRRICLPIIDGFIPVDEKEKIAIAEKLFDLNRQINAYGFFGPILEMPFGFLTNELVAVLDRHLGEMSEPKEAYMVVLTTPLEETFSARASAELLALAADIEEHPTSRDTFLQAMSFVDLEDGALKDRLHEHVQKYSWIVFSYRGPVRDEAMVLAELKYVLQQGDVRQKIQEKEMEHKELVLKQETYSKELGLSENERGLFEAARHIAFTKLYRKDMLCLCNYTIHLLTRPLYETMGLTLEDVDGFSAKEFVAMLRGEQAFSSEEIVRRREHTLYVVTQQDGLRMYSGDQAVNAWIREHVDFGEDMSHATEVKGQVASLGNGEDVIRAVIRRVETSADMKAFHDGEILLSSGTTPDLLPAMRRAAGFVTDTGGLTSHAAIVSRELKKPCIIGTNHATKVFKSGETVEFLVKEGIVRKAV